MDPTDRIQIGVVGKPHGVRGGFHLDGSIDAAALIPGRKLTIGGSDYTLASKGGLSERPLLSLTEIGDRDSIAALRGSAVELARSELTPLGEDEWLAADLIGLSVVDRDGRELGTVQRMVNLPSVDVLEVARGDDELLQLPMVHDAIVSIEPGAVITVDQTFLDLA